ncbi:MAG TPA: DUF4214 domain-containing protein, partial [Gemmataceae bacterium]
VLKHRTWLRVERLEDRVVPLAGFGPSQIRHAYGFDQIAFNGGAVQGTGSGQTIAIVAAYDQPNIAGDLAAFDATFGLPAPPSFTKVNQNGGAAYPAADTGWGLEISLDVEWAHAIAPGAKILLVEANSANWSDLLAAVNLARNQPGVSVVSMSWNSTEWSGAPSYDNYFTTPAGHNGVTFVSSSGDSGSSGGPESPAVSPNVLAVGGTQLMLDGAGNYSGETAWSGSGGGISVYEAQPAYQRGVVTQTTTRRAAPDVAYDASSATPFAVYDSFSYGGWLQVYGTSAGAPQWAALVAIADQGRVLAGKGTLDGATQTLPILYQLPGGDFHDITTGNSGAYAAGAGYDLVTGRGAPIANRVVAGLVGPDVNSPFVVNLYKELLGRTAAAAEVAGWDAALATGLSRDQIMQAFLNSTEYLSNVVRGDYARYLGRSAGSVEIAGWVAALQYGMSQEQAAAAFLQSPEYFQDHGGTFNGWLSAVYKSVLNRAADSGGVAGWAAVRSAGISLNQIALGILTSTESNYRFVASEYQAILQRPADAGGLNAFASGLGQGLSWENVIAALYGSAEFIQKNAGV